MVVCNRCGEKTDSLVACSALDLRLCKVCSDAYSDWLNMQVFVKPDTQANMLLHESNVKLEDENLHLKAKIKELDSKLRIKGGTETRIESVKSVADAKRVMTEEGYIYYKKPENWGKWNKNKHRKRRTKAEMEQDRQRGVGQ